LVPIESPYVTSYQSLIVTLAVFATVFEIFTVKDRKLLILLTCPFFDAPSGGTPIDIDVIYTPLEWKVHLMGYNSVADIIGLSSFV